MSQRILLVEDEEVQRTALETFVRAWGYEVITVETATGAIVYLSQNTVDMALIDLHLPDNPGIEILKHIRDTDGSIPVPVFMMSADDSPEIRIVCMSTGADDFLPKPLNFADVSMKIQQAFERVSYKKQIQELNAKLEKEKKSLQRYFSDDLVEKILSEEISTELGGTIVTASIMFFDIRGSTTMAEKIGPQAYAERISKLFADLMDIVFNNGGSINELLGDGILATFGCPFPKNEDAQNAVKAALAIESHMNSINRPREIAGKLTDFLRREIASAAGTAAVDRAAESDLAAAHRHLDVARVEISIGQTIVDVLLDAVVAAGVALRSLSVVLGALAARRGPADPRGAARAARRHPAFPRRWCAVVAPGHLAWRPVRPFTLAAASSRRTCRHEPRRHHPARLVRR